MPLENTIPQLAGTQVSDSRPGASASPWADMDSDAFAAFYERSARPLWAYLARVSGCGALADDLLQEAYIRFLAADAPRRGDFDGEVAARRYLFRIATNLMRDHWRRPRPTAIEDIPEEVFSSPDTSAQSDTRAILGPALLKLKPRERQLLWLAYAEGYSHREIAGITGLASASVRLLLFRARHKAAGLLQSTSEAWRAR
ncbi:MAG TPA: sigma-70 family RNA polymerase sigma factor [Terracidiphilus sp.]|jgi:RNA polymerase sigma-70 factor (ECF subfamily)